MDRKAKMVYGEALPTLNPCDPQIVVDLLAPYLKPDAEIADIGCGRGDTLRWLAAHTTYALYGVEQDSALLAMARAACPEAVLAEASADVLPFTDGTLDGAIMECVFSLLDKPEAATDELARVVREAGVLLLSDLYTQGTHDLHFAQSALLGHIYTKRTLEDTITDRGFSLVAFHDRTRDMRNMLAQMIMDGIAADCIDEESAGLLRQAKAAYGLWIWKRDVVKDR